MSGADLAAILIAITALFAVAAMSFALVSLTRSIRALREAVDTLRGETIPTVIDLRDTVHRANGEIGRVEGLIDTAESITTTVDSASKLTARAFSPLLIKIMSLGAGASRARRLLRNRDDPRRTIDVNVVDPPATVAARVTTARREEIG